MAEMKLIKNGNGLFFLCEACMTYVFICLYGLFIYVYYCIYIYMYIEGLTHSPYGTHSMQLTFLDVSVFFIYLFIERKTS
jgi:hypothetical protein